MNQVLSSTYNDKSLYKHKLHLNIWKITALVIAVILSIPVITVLTSLFFPNQEIWQHLFETLLHRYVLNSFTLMVGVGLITIIIGVSCAWLVTMCNFPGKHFFVFALLLPMAIPAYIIAYTYTGVFDVMGPFQTWLRHTFELSFGEYWFPEIRSMGGAIFVMSMVLYPYVYLLTRAALIEQSVCVLEVSRTLGCGPVRMFFSVAMPLIRPAIIVGVSLVMMETLADYGTVQYFGVLTFTTGIFKTWFGLDNSLGAAQLSAILLGFIIVLICLEQYSRRHAKYFHSSTKYTPITPVQLTGIRAILSTLFCGLVFFLGFALPVYFLIKWSLLTHSEMIDGDFWQLIWNSLSLALITAVCALLLSLIIVYGKRKFPDNFMSSILRFLSLGYAVPGTIIAVGVLLPFAWFDNHVNKIMVSMFNIDTGLILSGTIIVLVFAYLVRFLAISLNTLDASMQKVKPSLDEAAMTMGAGSATVITKIHLPLIRGSVLTAFLLVFVDVLKELPATLILRPFNFNTLAVKTYELANEERLIDAASPALAIVLAGLIPVILLSISINRSRPGSYAPT